MTPALSLGGRYTLLQPLARGGQAAVYLGRDELRGERVVLKELSEAAVLRRELGLLSRLHHPNVVEILDLVEHDGHSYLVQAYAAGEGFAVWAAVDRSCARVCLGAAAVLRALSYVHRRGIVHRDVKPENIRVADEELAGLPAARLIDFGLATRQPDAQVVGTLPYIAPEVLAGDPATPAADLYSLGVVLFEGLSGRLPLRELGRLVEDPTAVAGEAAELLRSLLDPRPERRCDHAALLESLSRAAGTSLAPTISDLQGALLPTPPLIGREATLARLEEALAEAREGRSTLLHLEGCGRSAVAREACIAARVAGCRVWRASRLADLRGLAAEAESSHLVEQLVDALLRGERPWLLCLDDVDPADAWLPRLLEQLTRALDRGQRAPGLVLYAGELPDTLAPRWQTLLLAPLDRHQTAALVLDLLAIVGSPPWLEQAFPTTGGDPRLVVELVYAQIAAGLPDALVADPDRDRLIARRVAALCADERLLLATLAATIRPLPFGLLEQLVPRPAPALRALIRKGLVSEEMAGLAPAQRSIPPAASTEDAQLHARFAAAWRAWDPTALDALGHHWLRAGRVRDGASALLRSVTPRLEDLRHASELLAVDDPLLPPILRAAAKLQRAQGDQRAALATAARVAQRDPVEGALLEAELLLDAGQVGPALEALGRCATRTARSCLLAGRAQVFLGRHAEAAEQAALGRGAPGLTPQLEGQLESLAGLSAVYLGHVSEGIEALARAAAIAEPIGDRETLIRVDSSRGIGLQRLGRLDEARAAYERCATRARALGDLRAAASATLNLGTIAHLQLDLGAALGHYRRAAELAHRVASGTTQVAALSNEANLLLLLGALDEATARLDDAERIAGAAGAQAELGYIRLYRAELRLLAGDADGASAALEADLVSADAMARDAADLLLGELCALHPLRRADTAAIAASLLGRVAWDSVDRWRVQLLAAKAELAKLAPDLGRARIDLELALALAAAAGASLLSWEPRALLASCTQGEESAYHAARFRATVDDLRARVPPAYRATFDARADLRRARALLREETPGAGTAPAPRDYQRLLAINEEINHGLAVEQLLGRILDCAIELTGAERGFVLLGEEELRLAAARNVDGESLRRGMEKLSQSIARLAMAQQRPLVIADALADDRFSDRCSIAGLRLRAVLCAPFRVRDGGRGALYVDNRFRSDAFTERHVLLIESFAHQAGIAITNAQLLEAMTTQARELEHTKEHVEALNRELEAKVAAQRDELTEISVRLRAHEEELVRKYNAGRIIGRSKVMRDLFASLDRVAEAEVPVLIWGESGTGKELIARAIHAFSARRDQPFVCVNCGAIAPTLLESELFGHVRGAFTGATRDRPGLFEAAGGGTLLLDEVGDMPPEMQVKLLRILQQGTFRRVGEERERRAACRVLSASHRRLDELVSEGKFREDLYYRLQVIQLEVPALRQRREDIPLLVEHILGSIKPGVTVSAAALAALLDFDWPGNIRQLENELRRAALLCEGEIQPAQLSIALPGRAGAPARTGPLRDELRRHEKQVIQAALREAGGKVSEAAQALGLHRVVLYRRMRELGLTPPRGSSRDRA